MRRLPMKPTPHIRAGRIIRATRFQPGVKYGRISKRRGMQRCKRSSMNVEIVMHERERLEDFRGGMVACRGCKRLLNFAPDHLVALVCCGILYRPEPGPLDLVIYDRVQAHEWDDALVLPPPHPVIVEATAEDVQRYVTLPDPGMETLDADEDYGEAE